MAASAWRKTGEAIGVKRREKQAKKAESAAGGMAAAKSI